MTARGQLSIESRINPAFETILRGSKCTNTSSTKTPGKKASCEYETTNLLGGDFSCGSILDGAGFQPFAIHRGLLPRALP
jgi:hypothetical protein